MELEQDSNGTKKVQMQFPDAILRLVSCLAHNKKLWHLLGFSGHYLANIWGVGDVQGLIPTWALYNFVPQTATAVLPSELCEYHADV